ncbi:hypothetical protein B005_5576 [Nocardiopsis alba ATCC BAA-2165]|uniref:Uncharacterized protein n=1 Tax=Nocardiopsis alba (strain ATCC BAA-2165 / BE74) TaxID=1205910 RepID=J7L949_NOCAA|nr:hypothetical protein B005_5576 [Nocardiopsis alba ATCC BAA-2165]
MNTCYTFTLFNVVDPDRTGRGPERGRTGETAVRYMRRLVP